MSTSIVISYVESIPLPDAAPQVRRPTKTSSGSNRPEALASNAFENQSLVADNSIVAEYIEAASLERKVEPISRAVLSNLDTTMQHLHEMAMHELEVLDALNNEGRQIIKTRLMTIWEEMSLRFERGDSINDISGTGGKGMGKYLRSIGVDPAQRRSWKFEIRQQEALRLAQEKPPLRKAGKKKGLVIEGETEANLIAKAGVKMAQILAGEGMMPPQERVNKAGVLAKDILGAIADGQFERLDPSESEALEPWIEAAPEDKKDKSPEGRLAVECCFVLTLEEKRRFMASVARLGCLKSTQLMYLAVVGDEA